MAQNAEDDKRAFHPKKLPVAVVFEISELQAQKS